MNFSNDSAPLSLEYLLSLLSISQFSNDNHIRKEMESNKNTLKNFKNNIINKLKENLLYYFDSPETLLNFKHSKEDEYFDFYKNIDCEIFLSSQNIKIKKKFYLKNQIMISLLK